MTPYFYSLGTTIISDDDRQQLLDVAVKHSDEFISYVMRNGKKDGNLMWRGEDLYNVPCIKKLVSSCVLQCIPVFIKHLPNSVVLKHIDSSKNKRNTVLSIPITPNKDYPPTFFYESLESDQPIAVSYFENMNACLLNTQEAHSVDNAADVDRINLQLMFDEPFDVIVKLIQDGALFHK